jgi:hypothetical protein
MFGGFDLGDTARDFMLEVKEKDLRVGYVGAMPLPHVDALERMGMIQTYAVDVRESSGIPIRARVTERGMKYGEAV